MSDWKKERRTGIGGSDAAAIVGLSPWRSPMDVWMSKQGIESESIDPDREFLRQLGTDLEPVIARLYERQTGKTLLKMPAPGVLRHKSKPLLIGTPDRWVEGEARGVELKSENQFQHEFGEPGTDQVPYHYLIQCAHYMALTDVPVWDVALLHGGTRFSIYTIHRDEELERDLIHELTAWWDRYVVANVPPDVDGSKAWRVYLNQKFPVNLKPIKSTDSETMLYVAALIATREQRKGLEQREDMLENQVKLAIAENDGIEGEFGKITWRKAKDNNFIDWHAAFDAMARKYGTHEEMQKEILSQFTVTRPGTRRMHYGITKGWSPNGGEISDSETRQLSDPVAQIQEGNSESPAAPSEPGTIGQDCTD